MTHAELYKRKRARARELGKCTACFRRKLAKRSKARCWKCLRRDRSARKAVAPNP